MKRIFPAVKLRPHNPPIDKREIGDAAISGERRIHSSPPSAPHPKLEPLANERAVSSDVALCDREELHHFLPVLWRDMLLLFSIMTLVAEITVMHHLGSQRIMTTWLIRHLVTNWLAYVWNSVFCSAYRFNNKN